MLSHEKSWHKEVAMPPNTCLFCSFLPWLSNEPMDLYHSHQEFHGETNHFSNPSFARDGGQLTQLLQLRKSTLSPLKVLKCADYIESTQQMLLVIMNFNYYFLKEDQKVCFVRRLLPVHFSKVKG